MAVHLEFIADSTEQIAERFGGTLGVQQANVELTADGDLYLSIDLRAPSLDDMPLSAAAAEFAALTEAANAAAARAVADGDLDSVVRVVELAAKLNARRAHLLGLFAADPTLRPEGDAADDDGAVPWAPIPADGLLDLGPAADVKHVAGLAAGDRVVHVGETWPVDAPLRRYIAPKAPVAHVNGVNTDSVILALPDGTESSVHRSKVAAVDFITASGDPVVVLGHADVADDDPADETLAPEPAPAATPNAEVPQRPRRTAPTGTRPTEVPDRFQPGTCPGEILAAVDAEPDRDWPLAEIVKAVTAKGYTDGTVKVSLPPLFQAGFLSRPRPGVYRSTLAG